MFLHPLGLGQQKHFPPFTTARVFHPSGPGQRKPLRAASKKKCFCTLQNPTTTTTTRVFLPSPPQGFSTLQGRGKDHPRAASKKKNVFAPFREGQTKTFSSLHHYKGFPPFRPEAKKTLQCRVEEKKCFCTLQGRGNKNIFLPSPLQGFSSLQGRGKENPSVPHRRKKMFLLPLGLGQQKHFPPFRAGAKKTLQCRIEEKKCFCTL
ncbi:MAG: hypothetical protein LC107_02740 [Chitinophagales bacterium]|nr:hypothetical protein [Chitinophagales bacterium]